MNKLRLSSGFTLFELLVSISIIAILTAIASASFSGAQRKARDSRRISDMNTIQKAAEQYYSFANYTYPVAKTAAAWTASNGQVTLDVFPRDPKLDSLGVGWTDYSTNTFTGSAYCFCAAMENAMGNSTNNTCTGFVNGTGTFYCVKNQQ